MKILYGLKRKEMSWTAYYEDIKSDWQMSYRKKFNHNKLKNYNEKERFYNLSVSHFSAHVFCPLVEVFIMINKKIIDAGDYVDVSSTTPRDFEIECGKVISKLGWRTQITQQTGDQGADIIAQKNDIRVAIQCKKYQSPVGNKAVQEIYAALGYYDAQLGFVVGVSGYTESAKQLASSTGVFLLDFYDLAQLDKFVSSKKEGPNGS